MQLNVALLVLATALEPKVKGSFLHKDQSKDIPEVVHSKEPGDGYLPGSPLYDKQEAGELPGQKKVYTAENMPPVSVTMQCVINLAVQYFLIYTAVVIVRTMNDLNGVKHSSSPMLATLQAATGTVAYAPMLCVLFLGTRMRALQLSEGDPDKYDLPQPFVKTAMFCCAYAVLGQTLLVLALPVVLGQTPSVSSDGTPEVKVDETSTVNRIIGTILGVLRWVCMGLLYGGFTVVCYGAVTMEAPAELWPDNTAPPVSPAVACTMNLSMQYFFVYLMIAIISTYEQFGTPTQLTRKLANVFNMSTNTVNFAPMLCILFIGARMRALQLDPKFGNPQPWAQNCFYMCTYSVLVQLLLVILVPLALGGTVVKGDSEGDVTFTLPNPTMFWILSGFRYVIMAALYGGFSTVIVGIFMMEGPKEIWGDAPPPVSPAVQATINLTIQFFTIYLVIALCRTAVQISGPSPFLQKTEETFKLAGLTVNFAPMLCILFIGARMRALQIDPKHGNPQKWAQMCFYLCTYSVLLQNILVIALPLSVASCTAEKGLVEGDVVFRGLNSTVLMVVNAVRYAAMLALYFGFTAVMVSVFVIEHPDGPELTPPLSPAMQCVMNLAVQYFTIMLLLFVSITVKQFTGMGEMAIVIFEAGQKTVMFCPMLAMLFIGCRMRALQLTKATDGTIPPSAGPQAWAQDGMFCSTWSVLVQLIMVLISPVFIGLPKMDEDGNVATPAGTNIIVAVVLDVIRYACLIAMYGGAITVVVAIYSMTPETLPPYAAREGLIPGVDVPKPPAPDTPGKFF